jgi:tripartite ATP-independent transporter DctP family solute receptor
MRLSKLASTLLLASSMLAAAPSAWSQAAQKPVTMKVGHVLGEADNVHQALVRFKEAVAKRTGGTVTVALYSGSTLGTLRQMFESIGLGTQEAGIFDAGTIANSEPAIGVLELPYIFENLDHVHRVVDGPIGKEIFDRARAKTGLRTLVSYDTTFRKTFSKRPINSIADFKGMKVRVPEVPSYIETFKLLGASPTPVPWGDLYTSLSSGVVDGFENKAEAAFGSRLHEQAKFAAYTGHIFVVNLLMVNERWFAALTPETQKALVDSAKETEVWQRARAQQSEVEFEEKMKTAGVQFTRPDTAALRTAVAPILTTYGSRHNVSALIERVRNGR